MKSPTCRTCQTWKYAVSGLALAVVSLHGGASFAQQDPYDPYPSPQVEQAPIAVPAPAPVPVQMPPAPVAPAPPQAVPPPPPSQPYWGQPGYYYPPPGYAAPIYSYPYQGRPVVVTPPPSRLRCTRCEQPPVERARYFSIGARLSGLGVDQSINGHDVFLGGVGLQARLRTRGRFGMEASLDFLHGDFKAPASSATQTPTTAPSQPYFHVGDVARDSVPFQLTALMYIFKNDDARIFNLYFLGGVGVIASTMSLTDENGQRVKQDFTEYEAHLGIGAELRFKWFAIESDVRGLALTRDDSDKPSVYYNGVDGGPVPKSSWGYHANLAATIWF